VSKAFGSDEAASLAPRVFTGLGGLTAQRLSTAMRVGEGIAGIAKLFQLHPVFWPRTYVDLKVQLEADRVRVALRACPALEESDGLTWFAGLNGASDRALDAIAHAVDRRARCRLAHVRPDEQFAYEIVIDPRAEPAADADEVVLAKFSSGATFVLTPTRAPQR
jgi:hypothetical protein